MRAILALLIVAVVVVIVLVMTDVINIDQIREASLPELEGGSTPAFDVDTADINVGTETREVEVPTIDIEGADEEAASDADAR